MKLAIEFSLLSPLNLCYRTGQEVKYSKRTFIDQAISELITRWYWTDINNIVEHSWTFSPSHVFINMRRGFSPFQNNQHPPIFLLNYLVTILSLYSTQLRAYLLYTLNQVLLQWHCSWH